MNAFYKVQTGVPKPRPNNAPQRPRRVYPDFAAMPVGSFFFTPSTNTKQTSAYVSRVTKDLPGKYSARHCFMRAVGDKWELCAEGDKGAVEGTGVWRDA